MLTGVLGLVVVTRRWCRSGYRTWCKEADLLRKLDQEAGEDGFQNGTLPRYRLPESKVLDLELEDFC